MQHGSKQLPIHIVIFGTNNYWLRGKSTYLVRQMRPRVLWPWGCIATAQLTPWFGVFSKRCKSVHRSYQMVDRCHNWRNARPPLAGSRERIQMPNKNIISIWVCKQRYSKTLRHIQSIFTLRLFPFSFETFWKQAGVGEAKWALSVWKTIISTDHVTALGRGS